MTKRQNGRVNEAERLAILKQAQEMGVPGWATPLWQAKYSVKKKSQGDDNA